ncbi:isoleucine--tRNA ligase [Mycoplasma bradburyae]|uniref:Isoleucine--tRNA ligase n=1 Tax=Mycoplasma bradburyae TaxID=2963128 RepID=A0ABT5GB80_9MOLU|nr:isoleucine--tRNA ligase [Mycoplasma bradburyae]MDC4181972.1 isoleucine--tRNA ligase [Mycoplasma bradburyae]UTS70397.1 isoleucine--tRNA ligase [Mycoplasma bradburyae]
MSKNYKDTLLMPSTNFEMKANLSTKESKIQQQWLDDNIYQLRLEKNKNNKELILHDGPPYANGNIHVGHTMNKIIKDIIVRRWLMQGYYSPYIPGWDTHGLPIEHAVQLKLGQEQFFKLSVLERMEVCRDFAINQIKNQKEQFKTLGLITDFKACYYTYDKQYEIDQLKVFAKMINEGLVYQDYKPIYWSWSSKSVLSDAEVEYKEVKSPSIYVKFRTLDNDLIGKDVNLIIWTTTPWTLPSNLAISVHPEFEYTLFESDQQKYLVGSNLYDKLVEKFQFNSPKVIKKIKGYLLDRIEYAHCLYPDKKGLVVLGEHVSDSDGTGLVHTAPGFGLDDFLVCKRYKIDAYVPINDEGCFDNTVYDQSLVGVFYDDANKIIAKQLEEKNALLGLDFIKHQAAHDWRSKKPVIYRATKQWFINIKSIKEQLINNIKSVKYPNERYEKRMLSMIAERSDWCISRQRTWGLPIPIIFDENKEPILDKEIIDNTIRIMETEGVQAWYQHDAKYFLTNKYDPRKTYYKETDILDVWFDSGTSFNILKHNGIKNKAAIYFEGNDQYRGWFNSSMICATVMNKTAPYEELISHGFTLDEKGFKMSKSQGNVIDPLTIIKDKGADILRLWAASIDYSNDHRIGNKIIEQNSEIYRKIRNSLFRFILGNLNDFDFKDLKTYKLSLADLLTINQVNKSFRKIDQAYLNYDYLEITKEINKMIVDLSSWYFELIKDSLYCNKKDDSSRRAIQATLNYIFINALYRIAPILVHTCEEVYSFYTAPNKEKSIYLINPPSLFEIKTDIDLEQLDNEFNNIKDAVYAEIEKLRKDKILSKSNEAVVYLSSQYLETNKQLVKSLKQWLNVADVLFTKNQEITVKKTDFLKCLRCWNYFKELSNKNNEICDRCSELV